MTLLLSVCCLNISDVGDIIAQYKHQLELTNTAPSATQQLAFNNSQGSLSALNNNQPQPQQQPQQQQQQQQLQQSQLQLSLGEYYFAWFTFAPDTVRYICLRFSVRFWGHRRWLRATAYVFTLSTDIMRFLLRGLGGNPG